MGRTARDKTELRPKPVEKIQLSEKKPGWKLAGSICLLIVGVTALVYGFFSLLSGDTGWREIEANTTSELNCADEFVFMYNIGASGVSARTEMRAITGLYSEAAEKAYGLFNNDVCFDGLCNVRDINQNPNQVLTVDDVLYQAFSQIQESSSRYLYLAPLFSVYDNVFYCGDDSELVSYDPMRNPEIKAEFEELLVYVQDPDAVELELLGENQVRLSVSEAYLQYAQENEVEDFIDFYWMKNAFIIDYLADVLTENGYTLGSISSYDGFVRNLDESASAYSFNLYNRVGQTVYPAAVMEYHGPASLVYLRNYPMNSLDSAHYYELENGEIRTPYLDIRDGSCKSAVNELVCYSDSRGCAEILLRMIPIYIADTFSADDLKLLTEEDMDVIYYENQSIRYSEDSLSLSEFYEKDGVAYTASLIS